MENPDGFRVFLSCKFPLSPLANLCRSVGNAVGLEIRAADRPELAEIMEKVKREMLSADAALFLLEPDPEEQNTSLMTDWMKAEYGIARAMNKVIGVINADKLPLPSMLSKDVEWLKAYGLKGEDAAVKIAAFLYSMRNKIESMSVALRDISKPPYIRDFLKHRVKLSAKGRLLYETHVQIKCLKNGLGDVRHSIHMNYSLCWSQVENDKRPQVDLVGFDDDHTFSLEPVAWDALKFTFKINFSPPLQQGETIGYGWRSEFPHYLPLTKAELEPLTASANYPFPEGCVEHHYFINHPTKLLVLRLEFEDGSIIGACRALSFVGRTFSTRSLDKDEVERIKDKLTVEDFLGTKQVTLTVEHPRFGNNYAIQWSLNR